MRRKLSVQLFGSCCCHAGSKSRNALSSEKIHHLFKHIYFYKFDQRQQSVLNSGKATIESLTTYRNACPKKGAIFDLYASAHDTHAITFRVHVHLSALDAPSVSLECERRIHLHDFYNNESSIQRPRRSSQEKAQNTGWPGTHMENEPTWLSHTMKKEHRTTLNFQMQISKHTNERLIHYHISGSPPHFQFNPFLHSDRHLRDF